MADLQRELATYRQRLSELQMHNGKFVLIKDEDVEGVFDSYADALRSGYEKFKLTPFLVKQVAPEEQVMNFTRDLVLTCQ